MNRLAIALIALGCAFVFIATLVEIWVNGPDVASKLALTGVAVAVAGSGVGIVADLHE